MESPRTKVGRNEPCPCGSGKKYKKCCNDKAFQYVTGADGEINRQIPLYDEARSIVAQRLQMFKEEFGREAGPDDRIFWEEPEHAEHGIVEAMKKANINPAIIYAFQKTGRLVSEDNLALIPERDLAEWNAATAEYEELYGASTRGQAE